MKSQAHKSSTSKPLTLTHSRTSKQQKLNSQNQQMCKREVCRYARASVNLYLIGLCNFFFFRQNTREKKSCCNLARPKLLAAARAVSSTHDNFGELNVTFQCSFSLIVFSLFRLYTFVCVHKRETFVIKEERKKKKTKFNKRTIVKYIFLNSMRFLFSSSSFSASVYTNFFKLPGLRTTVSYR